MTDAQRLKLLLDVANDERWVDRDHPDVERVPKSRKRLVKRLHDFIDSEDTIDVGPINTSVREWMPRFRRSDGEPVWRTDLTDHEIEQIRLEELRFLLGQVLRGTFSMSIVINVGVHDGIQRIGGAFPDVVLYLAVRLLADSHLAIGECEAPEAGEPGRPNSFDRACAGLFVVQRRGRGHYCSAACRGRAHNNPKWKKHLAQLRKEPSSAGRKA
jgi:hypothetical protein